MFLPQHVDQLEAAFVLDMPEGPAIARRRTLKRRADLVDRTRMSVAGNRTIGVDRREPAALRVSQDRTWRNHPAFDQQAECDSWLAALVGHDRHGAFIERKGC